MCTVNLACRLDLKKIALHARNAEYNPKRFAAVIMRIRDPRTTALIFSSGKMVCTGAKRFVYFVEMTIFELLKEYVLNSTVIYNNFDKQKQCTVELSSKKQTCNFSSFCRNSYFLHFPGKTAFLRFRRNKQMLYA